MGKKWSVTVTRTADVTQEAIIEVEADNEDDAEALALAKAALPWSRENRVEWDEVDRTEFDDFEVTGTECWE